MDEFESSPTEGSVASPAEGPQTEDQLQPPQLEPSPAEGSAGRPAEAPRRRRRFTARRLVAWVGITVAILAVVAIASTYLYFANVYMPLAMSGYGPDTSSGSLFVRRANGEFGEPETFVYCSRANGHIAFRLSLFNDGDYPVTVLGGDPGPGGPVSDHHLASSFTLIDLATSAPGRNDPWAEAPIRPTTLEYGRELTVWARFQLGPEALQGVSIWQDRIWVRYSVFGITRTAEVPLIVQIAVTSSCSPTGPA